MHELSEEFGFSKATICNWAARYDDFPAPVLNLAAGPVYSRRQVRRWYDDRKWQPGKHDKK